MPDPMHPGGYRQPGSHRAQPASDGPAGSSVPPTGTPVNGYRFAFGNTVTTPPVNTPPPTGRVSADAHPDTAPGYRQQSRSDSASFTLRTTLGPRTVDSQDSAPWLTGRATPGESIPAEITPPKIANTPPRIAGPIGGAGAHGASTRISQPLEDRQPGANRLSGYLPPDFQQSAGSSTALNGSRNAELDSSVTRARRANRNHTGSVEFPQNSAQLADDVRSEHHLPNDEWTEPTVVRTGSIWSPADTAAEALPRVTDNDKPLTDSPFTTSRSIPDRPQYGIPGWLAVTLLVVIAGSGGLIDQLAGASLTKIFGWALTGGSVLAILLVRRRNMFSVVVSPPLVYVAAAAIKLFVSKGQGKLLIIAQGWMAYGFTTIAAATAAVLLIAGVRMIIRR